MVRDMRHLFTLIGVVVMFKGDKGQPGFNESRNV